MNRFTSFILILIVSSSAYGKKAKSPLILLSIDGFAYDYLATYQPRHILEFGKSGVKSKLLPVYPSKTFPNHLSIITGVYPVNHGIIHNNFYQPDIQKQYYKGAGKKNSAWLTAKPFWSFAEEHSITSAVYFWPESEAIGQGSLPTYNIPYNKTVTDKARFDQIIDWLKLPEDKSPEFIVSYFSSVDAAGHNFGLGSPELAQAVTNIDETFGYFIERLKKDVPQSVNVVLVSDHGMVQINKNKKVYLSEIFNDKQRKLMAEKSMVIAKSNTQLYIYFNEDKLNQHQQEVILQELHVKQKENLNLYNVYQKKDYPEHWRLDDDLAIIPDLIIEAVPTASFSNKEYKSSSLATHGYDPKDQSELAAIFFASGPSIIEGRAVSPFENIHVVPLLSQLLGIKQLENIDGKVSILLPITK